MDVLIQWKSSQVNGSRRAGMPKHVSGHPRGSSRTRRTTGPPAAAPARHGQPHPCPSRGSGAGPGRRRRRQPASRSRDGRRGPNRATAVTQGVGGELVNGKQQQPKLLAAVAAGSASYHAGCLLQQDAQASACRGQVSRGGQHPVAEHRRVFRNWRAAAVAATSAAACPPLPRRRGSDPRWRSSPRAHVRHRVTGRH